MKSCKTLFLCTKCDAGEKQQFKLAASRINPEPHFCTTQFLFEKCFNLGRPKTLKGTKMQPDG